MDPSPSPVKTLLSVLTGEARMPPPVWLMRQAGRYLPEYRALRARVPDFLEFCFTPELAIEAALQPIRRFGLDAAILFSDILVVPHALGQKVTFREGEGPLLEAITDTAALARLTLDRVEDRLEPVVAALRGLAQALGREVALIGFAGAPWTLATYMVEGRGGTDLARVRRWAFEDEAGFGRLVALLVDAVSTFLIAQVRAGAEAVQLFDTWAGVLDDEQFGRWVTAPTAEIRRRLAAACPGLPVIGFPRGAGARAAAYAEATGVDGLGLDSGTPIAWAVANVRRACALQGNLDNLALAVGGAALERGVAHILAQARGRALVFNLGHGVLPETPPANVARLVELVRAGGGGA